MSKPATARAAAARMLQQVLQHGKSLSHAIVQESENLSASERAFAQAICYQVMRQLPVYEWLVAQLLEKPLKTKVRIVHYILLVGLCQLRDMRVPAHAAIAESVEACSLVRQKNLKAMVNAVLRGYQRQQQQLNEQLSQEQEKSAALRVCHPGWLVQRLQQAYPDNWQQICAANNAAPPLWLRVNQQHHTSTSYLAELTQAGIAASIDSQPGPLRNQHNAAVRLQHGTDVTQLPGFAAGHVAVQDRSAQFAAHLLSLQPGMRVLDACAAPGGKTVHLLEHCPQLQVTALDADAGRLTRVHENLARMQVTAKVVCGDASAPSQWWDGEQYDRILLDAPCSATGVIRRHPDIKWLRRNNDIATLVNLQKSILHAMWPLLKPGGRLLYATCSVLPDENRLQIQDFLATVKDAVGVAITDVADSAQAGWQLLPRLADDASPSETASGDGFFYFLLEKRSDI